MAFNFARHHDFKLALPGVNRVPTGQPRTPHATTRAIFFNEFSTPINYKGTDPLQFAYLATTNSGSVQESRSGVMRGREMPHIEAIQTFVQFSFSHFGNYF